MNPFQSDNIWKKKARQGKAQQHPLTPQQEWQKQVNSRLMKNKPEEKAAKKKKKAQKE